jgi:hypothetical protein
MEGVRKVAPPEGMTDKPVPIPPGVSFTVSARGKAGEIPILSSLAQMACSISTLSR